MNIRYSSFFVLSALLLLGNLLHAQNCTVNAGIGQTVCFLNGATLSGNVGGAYDNTQLSWTLVSGPPVTLQNANQLRAQASNLRAQAVYIFRLSAVCADGGIASDTITLNVNGPLTAPLAGADRQICDTSSSRNIVISLSANATIGSEIGTWSVSGGSPGIFVPNNSDPNAEYRFADTTCTTNSEFRFIWSIESSGCAVSDEMVVRYNRTPAVSAGRDTTVKCGEVLALSGSCPGGLPGRGTWSVISASNPPLLTDASSPGATLRNLLPGRYELRWTVQGACASGSDDLVVTVVPVTATEVTITADTIVNCDNRFMLRGTPFSPPQQGRWTILSGPASGVLSSPNSSSTDIIQADTGYYIVRYEVVGPCFSGADTIRVRVRSAQQVSNANAGPNQSYCTNSLPSVINLQASAAANRETATWSQISGPATLVISDVNNPLATITGYGAAGTYTLRWRVMIDSCKSDDLVDIIINEPIPSVTAGPDQILACGISSVSFGPNPQNGQWQIVSQPIGANSSAGLNSYSNLSVPGNYVFRYTFANTCNSLSDNINVFASPGGQAGLANAGTDQSLACNVVSCALAGNLPSGGSGTWSQVSGPSAAVFDNTASTTPNVTGLVTGTYVFRWTIADGPRCPTRQDDVVVRVSTAFPLTPSAGNDFTVCAGTPVRLSGSALNRGATGLWTQVSGPSVNITNANQPNANIAGLPASNVFRFRWTLTNTCGSAFDEIEITSTSDQGPSAALAGPDQCLPAGNWVFPLAASAPANGIGTWSLVNGPTAANFANANLSNTNVSVTGNGTFVFRWTVATSPACASTLDDVTVTLDNPLPAAVAGPDQQLCGASQAQLAATVPTIGVGTWTQFSGPIGPVISIPASANSNVTGLSPGQIYTFRWSVQNGACSAVSDDVTIITNTPPSAAAAGNDINRCDNTTFTLGATLPTSGVGTWSIIGGTARLSFVNPTANNASVTVAGPGTAVLRWTVSTGVGCPETSDDITVNINYAPSGNSVVSLCGASVANLSVPAPGTGTGSWQLVNGPSANIAQTNAAATTANLLGGAGVYRFRWTVTAPGCPTTSADILILNAQTPTNPVAGPDQNICPTSLLTTIQLTGNNPTVGGGAWQRVSGPGAVSITSSSSPSTSVVGLEPGSHRFRYTIINGACRDYDDVDINIFGITPPIAGPDRLLCSGSQVSLAGNQPTAGIGTWSQVSGPSGTQIATPNFGQSLVTNLQPGRYIFRWTVENGTCRLTDDVNINVGIVPTPSISPATTIFCAGESVSLTANGMPAQAGTYQWGGPAGFGGTTSSLSLNNLQGSNSGTYLLTLTDAVGCSAIVSKNIQVSVPQVQAFNGGPYCQGATMSVTGQVGAGQAFAWQGNSVNSATPLSFTLPTAQAGPQSYTLSTTDANGCTASSTTTVLVYSTNVTVSNSGPVCGAGNPVVLIASVLAPATFSWSNGTQTFSGASVTVTPGVGTSSYQLITNFGSGCTNTTTTNVTVNGIPTLNNLPILENRCEGQSFSLAPTYSPDVTTVTWTTPSGTLLTQNDLQFPSVAISNQGRYSVTFANAAGCSATSSFVLGVWEQPIVSLPASIEVCAGTSATVIPTVNILRSTFHWPNGTTDRQVELSAGYYVLTATYGFCSDTASILITERACIPPVCTFALPNVFTPNADGLNDSFGIISPCSYNKYRMEIYNRWGQLIYKTFDQRSNWDGTYQNEPAPADAYVYMVYFGDAGSEKLQAQGDVSLLR